MEGSKGPKSTSFGVGLSVVHRADTAAQAFWNETCANEIAEMKGILPGEWPDVSLRHDTGWNL